MGIALQACMRDERVAARTIELTQVRPLVLDDVYLNEPLVFHFSAELERASVNDVSVQIATRDGRPARGERIVEGKQLRFEPDPVRQPDLSDGGYLPGTTYVVRLAGFPRPEGLRDVHGVPLAASLELEFRTVPVTDRSEGFVFLDRTLGRAEPLRLTAGRRGPAGERVISGLDGIEFEGEEPLDPASLFAEDFRLDREVPGGFQGERVPLRAVLLENHDKGLWPPRGTTRVQLLPAIVLEPGRYLLSYDQGACRLRDFGRNRVPIVDESGRPRSLFVIEVEQVLKDEAPREHVEEFLDPGRRSPAVVADADGSARWDGSGRVELRWPAAAGSGSDGEQLLEGPIDRGDVQATRLEIAAGRVAAIEVEGGLAVLRSQGQLVVGGKLVRAALAPALEIAEPESLSAWLERARRDDTPCTVLIAGGDLVVSGEILVGGPLLLVAGGRLRVLPGGRISAGGREVQGTIGTDHWYAGAVLLHAADPLKVDVRAVPLALDAPLQNPLRVRLRFAALSQPLPQGGLVSRWLPAPVVRGHRGRGRYAVRYVGGSAGTYEESTVDDPAMLVDCTTLRLLVELELGPDPGGAWDPPSLDSVTLRWEVRP
jgi:hypothetical protein